ncbi:hypothetical protein AAH013_10985 [Phocaeicola dorei]
MSGGLRAGSSGCNLRILLEMDRPAGVEVAYAVVGCEKPKKRMFLVSLLYISIDRAFPLPKLTLPPVGEIKFSVGWSESSP